MLFDLRGRGRRRTVQVIYLGLAVIMLGGLLLVGVGTGSGGGILNAFTNNGSGNAQQQVVSQQEKNALRATRLRPTDPSAWSSLVQARWSSAGQGSDYNSTTGQFTANGKKELTAATQAWQRYVQLQKSPDTITATLAARAYSALANFPGEATAWEYVTLSNPSQVNAFECLAASAYAAKQPRKGDLATAKALTLVPKAQQFQVKQQLSQAKTNPQVAQSC
ncbi:MAG: hypothetical protein M3Z06_13235 [Actinomycetota bacterium]|nr:hypothetical protein [Actinomycetota bacterium]